MTIGVFDSGLGGLTVLKQLIRILPEYEYCYLGDNARTPYGDRSPERIYEFTESAVAYLFEHGCGLVILACNTASAEALRRLQHEFLPAHYPDRKILGVLIPTAEVIAHNYADKKIGIVGTRATIQSEAYVREIKKLAPSTRIEQSACPLLVPFIEEGCHDTVPGRMVIKKYLLPFKQKQVDALVLGCTHYALIKQRIASVMGRRVAIIDPGLATAKALRAYLGAHPEIEKRLSRKGSVTLLSTDVSARVTRLVRRYWGAALPVAQVLLEK